MTLGLPLGHQEEYQPIKPLMSVTNQSIIYDHEKVEKVHNDPRMPPGDASFARWLAQEKGWKSNQQAAFLQHIDNNPDHYEDEDFQLFIYLMTEEEFDKYQDFTIKNRYQIKFDSIKKEDHSDLLQKLISIINNYTDDKSCEADAAIEKMRKTIRPKYKGRYD